MWCMLYTLVHMHNYTREILPVESLSCNMMLKYWVIHEIIWLTATPRYWVARVWVAWQTRSTWVGRQVKQCHGMRFLSLWDQHVESSCVLMHHYWNDENCWVVGMQYVNYLLVEKQFCSGKFGPSIQQKLYK